MVKFIKFSSVIFVFSLFSCARVQEPDLDAQKTRDNLVLKAFWSQDDDSRTLLHDNGTSFYWSLGETINVFRGNQSAMFTSVNKEIAAVVDFEGSLNFSMGSDANLANDLWAVYPYNEDNTFDGESVTLTLPVEQTGCNGTFADKFFPAVAKSSSSSLAFYNVCGGVRFSVVKDGVKRVVFRSVDGSPMAGTVRVGFGEDNKPVILSVSNSADSVAVNAPAGGFLPGEFYYATLIPYVHSDGISISLHSQSLKGKRDLDTSKEVKRSVFGELRRVDNDIDYGIIFNDPEVERICVEHFDSSSDGLITESEAAAVRSLDKFFRSNKKICSFSELSLFSGLTALSDSCFIDCTALKTIDLPEKLDSLRTDAFSGCIALAKISFSSGLEIIESGVFKNCTSLTEADLSASSDLSSIGKSAFNSCSSLQRFISPSGLEIIGEDAFKNCTSLTEADLSASSDLSSIGKSAFNSCSSLWSMKMPAGVISFGDYCFCSCSSLRSFMLPTSLETIGEGAFMNCSSFVMGKDIFNDCSNLRTIGTSAFYACPVTSEYRDIMLPASVDFIGNNALKQFNYVILKAQIPPTIFSDSFNKDVRIGVPADAIKRYKTKKLSGAVWASFANWVYPDSEEQPFRYPPTFDPQNKSFNLFGHKIDFIKVEGGSYTMGKNTVTISKPFWLAATQCTREIWIDVMRSDPSNFLPTNPEAIYCPVTRVSWEKVFEFISAFEKLVPGDYHLCLPTEAQWVFAAKGGNASKGYMYSGSDNVDDVAWYTNNSRCCLDTTGAIRKQPHPVATKSANELGFYDMSGNVFEWVNDYYGGAYVVPQGKDPTGPATDSQGRRVLLGGDYLSDSKYCLLSYRSYAKQATEGSNYSFRLVLKMDTPDMLYWRAPVKPAGR